jgi:hypothetical protein
METFKDVALVVGPVVYLVVGALLQHLLSRSAESRRHLTSLRSEAYTDYLRCLADSARIRGDVNRREELFARAADAKTRVSIYGSPKAVTALAAFEKAGARIDTPQSVEAMMALAAVMRRETAGASGKISPDDLQIVLFGNSR